MEQFKSVKEVAELMNISVQAVYKRLNNLDTKFKDSNTKRINNKLMLSENLINELMSLNQEVETVVKEVESTDNNVINDKFKELNDNYIAELKRQINKLENDNLELKTDFKIQIEKLENEKNNKDIQIKELSTKNNELDTHLKELNNQLIGIITGEQQIKIGTIITDNNKINSTSVLKEKVTDDIVEHEATATQNNHNNRPNTFNDAPIKKSWIDVLFKR